MPKDLIAELTTPDRAFLVFLFILCINACSPKPEAHRGYYTGLTVLKEFDKSRTFDMTGTEKAPFYFRPVKIDLFYPSSEKPSLHPLVYGDLLDQYELRMNYNTPYDSCRKSSLGLAAALAEYLHVANSLKILEYKTDIYQGLRLPAEKHPLIIYAAGMNGSSWENSILFDSLVKRGYVVAALSSVGKFPGYMAEAVDIGEQVRDILFARQRLSALPFIDTARIGLMSWSLGGTSITKAAMLSGDFKALLSMDGTELHYCGVDTAWDRQYKQIMQIPPFAPEQISAPYCYLSSEHPGKYDSLYLFPYYTHSKDKYFLKLNKSIHEDFSSIVAVAKGVSPGMEDTDSARYAVACGIAATFFDQYLGREEALKASQGDHEGPAQKNTTGEYIRRLIAERPASFDTVYPHK